MESRENYRWSLDYSFKPIWYCWEDECAVYNRIDGSTHSVDRLVVIIFTELQRESLTTADLISKLNAQPLPADCTTQELNSLLFALEEQNFIRRKTC